MLDTQIVVNNKEKLKSLDPELFEDRVYDLPEVSDEPLEKKTEKLMKRFLWVFDNDPKLIIYAKDKKQALDYISPGNYTPILYELTNVEKVELSDDDIRILECDHGTAKKWTCFGASYMLCPNCNQKFKWNCVSKIWERV